MPKRELGQANQLLLVQQLSGAWPFENEPVALTAVTERTCGDDIAGLMTSAFGEWHDVVDGWLARLLAILAANPAFRVLVSNADCRPLLCREADRLIGGQTRAPTLSTETS